MYLICIEQPGWSERYLFQNKQNAIRFLKSDLIPDLYPGVENDAEELDGYARRIVNNDESGIWLEELEVMDGAVNSSRRRSRLNSSVAYKIIDKRHQTLGAESGFVIPESDLYRELDKIAREQYGYSDEREIKQFMFDVTDGIHPDFVVKETTLRDDYDGYYR